VQAALTRYRVIAYVVGVALLLLTAGVFVQVFGHDKTLVEIVGPVHGFLYIGYVILGYDLGRRAGWPLSKILLVLLAGVVPFLTFVAERRVTRELRAPAATA
jgi:integral membrane protein